MKFKKFLKIFLASISLPLMLIGTTLATDTEVKITREALRFLKDNFTIQGESIVVKNSNRDDNYSMYLIYSKDFGQDPASAGALIVECRYQEGNVTRDREPFCFDNLCELLSIKRASCQAITRLIYFAEELFYTEDEIGKWILALPDEVELSEEQTNHVCYMEGTRWRVTRDQLDAMNLVPVSGEEARRELLA